MVVVKFKILLFGKRFSGPLLTKCPSLKFYNCCLMVFNMSIFSRKAVIEFSKFALVGVINTAIHLIVLYSLTEFFGLWYIFSSFFAYLVAVTNSNVLNTIWTFKRNIRTKTIGRYIKFFSVSTLAGGSNLFFLYIFTEFFGIGYILSQLIAIGLTLTINFLGNKFWTFQGRA